MDWSALPKLPDPSASGGETKWVVPEHVVDQHCDNARASLLHVASPAG